MGLVTSLIMGGAALFSAAKGYSDSRVASSRAKAQASLSASQGKYELSRTAQNLEEATQELEDARKYQAWKEQYVLPALSASLKRNRMPDAGDLSSRVTLARGIQAQQAMRNEAAQAADLGFDLGGSRQVSGLGGIVPAVAAQNTATTAQARGQALSQGISNTANLVSAGRQVYKQEGIV